MDLSQTNCGLNKPGKVVISKYKPRKLMQLQSIEHSSLSFISNFPAILPSIFHGVHIESDINAQDLAFMSSIFQKYRENCSQECDSWLVSLKDRFTIFQKI